MGQFSPLQFSLLPEFFLESCDQAWLFPTSASSTLDADVQIRPIGVRKARRLALPGEATHAPPALLYLSPGPFVIMGPLAGRSSKDYAGSQILLLGKF